MGKRFDLDAAYKLCESLEKTVQMISSESEVIRNLFAVLNDSFSDGRYDAFQGELTQADYAIDSICEDILSLVSSLRAYTNEMSLLLSDADRLSSASRPRIQVAKNTEAVKTIRNWLPAINPNFDRFDINSPYSNNCGSCAFAVFQRLEGINSDACASEQNIGFNYQMENLTGLKQVKTTPNEIESYLLSAGNGAHAIIGVDRSFGPGHWFNAVCIDNKVYAVDGQSGEIMEWPPEYGNVVNWEMSVREV